MSCSGVEEDTYVVSVQFPETGSARRRRLWIRYGPRCCICFTIISVISFIVGLTVTLNFCNMAPQILLDDFAIRDMAVFHNVTTNSPPWQVTSDIKFTLSMRNRNTVTRCFTTLRRMNVFVYYQGNLISDSGFSSGFALKPRKSREVLVELKGKRFQMASEVGAALEADLRSDSVPLVMEIDARYLVADRRSFWTHQVCELVATTPLNSYSRLGTLLGGECLESVVLVT